MTEPVSVKTIFAIIKGCFKFDASHKKRLAEQLRKIADLLDTVKSQLENGIVPRESSYQLATLINFTNETLHGVFKIANEEELVEIFSEQLPHIGYLLRSADVFIDGQPRSGVHKYMRVLEARNDDYQISSASVTLAAEEITRCVGRLRGAVNSLDPKSGGPGGKKGASKKPSTSKVSNKKTPAKKGLVRKATKR